MIQELINNIDWLVRICIYACLIVAIFGLIDLRKRRKRVAREMEEKKEEFAKFLLEKKDELIEDLNNKKALHDKLFMSKIKQKIIIDFTHSGLNEMPVFEFPILKYIPAAGSIIDLDDYLQEKMMPENFDIYNTFMETHGETFVREVVHELSEQKENVRLMIGFEKVDYNSPVL